MSTKKGATVKGLITKVEPPTEAREPYAVEVHGDLEQLCETIGSIRGQRGMVAEKVHKLWDFLFEGSPDLREAGTAVCSEPEGSGLLVTLRRRIVGITNDVADEVAGLTTINDLLQALLDRLGSDQDAPKTEGP